MSALDNLIEAVRAERATLLAEIEEDAERLKEKRERVKRYDRMLGPDTSENGSHSVRAPRKRTRDTNVWKPSEKNMNAIYLHMAGKSAVGGEEFTAMQIAEDMKVGYSTVMKALQIMHTEGRVRLSRMAGATKIWAVVK